MNRRLRPAIVLLAAVLAGASLGACGDKADKAGAGTPSASASTPVVSGVKLTKDNFFDTVLAAMVKADSTHVAMSTKAGSATTRASGEIRFADPQSLAMSMVTAAGRVQVVLADGVFYIRAAKLSGDQYVIVETDGEDQLSRLYRRLPDLMNPTFQAKTYGAAARSITQTGDPISIDGVRAAPYVIVMDTAKMGDLANLGLPDVASKTPDTVKLTWWVGPDDLVRRSDMAVLGTTTRVTYSKWGEKVSIKKPGDVSDKTLQELINEAPA